LLKEAKGRALIISAGSALRPLLMRNIKPDFFAIIDPQDITYNQIKGYENIGIPLFIWLLPLPIPFHVTWGRNWWLIRKVQ